MYESTQKLINDLSQVKKASGRFQRIFIAEKYEDLTSCCECRKLLVPQLTGSLDDQVATLAQMDTDCEQFDEIEMQQPASWEK
jgi:hypothetical protein